MGLSGLESGQSLNDYGFVFNRSPFITDDLTSYVTGYPNGISKFKTSIGINFENQRWVYFNRVGTLPGTITWPNPEKFNIDSKDPNALSLSVGEPVEFISVYWESSVNNSNLVLTSPKLAPRFGAVPDEMLNAHAEYQISREIFPNPLVSFWAKTSDSRSFDTYISAVFGTEETEYQDIVIDVSN